MHGFLELTDKAGNSTVEGNTELDGVPFDGVNPVISNDVSVTGSDISSGDAGEKTASSIRPENMDQYIANIRNSVDSTTWTWV